MERSLVIETAESTSFDYELAGLGSRFLALCVDSFIQTLLLIAVSFVLGPWAGGSALRLSTSIVVAFVIAILFLILFGYFIAFEGLWNGQTPGKKLLGIRVLRDGGFPADLTSALVRNLVRVGEAILGAYGISAIVTLLSPENKRIGDYAAGTIVVRDLPAQIPYGPPNE